MNKKIFVLSTFFAILGCGFKIVKTFQDDLPDTEIAQVRLTTGNTDVPVRIKKAKIDYTELGDGIFMIKTLPGRHVVSFEWSFQTADEEEEDRGLMLSWRKSGLCKVSFATEKGRNYSVEGTIVRSGTYLTNPQVVVTVIDCGTDFKCGKNVISEGLCTYNGRKLDSMIRLEF